MEARYCKHCGSKLKPSDSTRCMKCFLEIDGGRVLQKGFWRRSLYIVARSMVLCGSLADHGTTEINA
jgi:hypothetical protein